jgi:hypothetical protein
MAQEDLASQEIRSLKLLLYLMPVFGIVPAIWSLSRPGSNPAERNLSRMSIRLALGWFAGYILFDIAAQSSGGQIPVLLASSLFTSGYFVLNLIVMLQLWQKKTVQLPFLGRISRLP